MKLFTSRSVIPLGRILAAACTMFVGTMLVRKLEMVGVVMLPVYSGVFSNTVPRPGRTV